MKRRRLPLLWLLSALSLIAAAQTSASSSSLEDSELRFVVYLSRHGVRSPTGKAAQYNVYSTASWPEWEVAPGYLTPHGFRLMELFGAFDRMQLADEKLFHPGGCDDAASVTIYADSDQRTRETGRALSQGLFPGCDIPIQTLPEGSNDPLFHPVPAALSHLDPAIASAAVAGRIGGNPANLALVYREQLASLDHILATCGTPSAAANRRTSLFDIPATLSPGKGDHLVDLKGPINTASTLSENLLLEYTEGMDTARVGWGCVDHAKLQELMELHTAATDFAQRTPEIARAQASNLIDQIDRAIQQAVTRKTISVALSKPSDKALFLIGHDTNLENIAGVLQLDWIIDGRRDDTPPGSTLIFEVWRKPQTGVYSVRTYFAAQTLDQMRMATPLTSSNRPERVQIFIPGCSGADLSCTVPDFLNATRRLIDSHKAIPK